MEPIDTQTSNYSLKWFRRDKASKLKNIYFNLFVKDISVNLINYLIWQTRTAYIPRSSIFHEHPNALQQLLLLNLPLFHIVVSISKQEQPTYVSRSPRFAVSLWHDYYYYYYQISPNIFEQNIRKYQANLSLSRRINVALAHRQCQPSTPSRVRSKNNRRTTGEKGRNHPGIKLAAYLSTVPRRETETRGMITAPRKRQNRFFSIFSFFSVNRVTGLYCQPSRPSPFFYCVATASKWLCRVSGRSKTRLCALETYRRKGVRGTDARSPRGKGGASFFRRNSTALRFFFFFFFIFSLPRFVPSASGKFHFPCQPREPRERMTRRGCGEGALLSLSHRGWFDVCFWQG